MYQRYFKRPADLLVAACGLVLLSPLFVLLGFAVAVSHGLPVLFRQARPGRAGKPFDGTIYPGEGHAFVRARTWRDAFARIEAFFDAHLRRGRDPLRYPG